MLMYIAGFSNVITSVGTMAYVVINRGRGNCDKRGDDLLYFVAFPSLMIREMLVAGFAINRYAVCVYGLTYHLKMDKKKMGIMMLLMCLLLYAGLTVIHQITRFADNTARASHTAAFKIFWAACEILATFLLCFFNLLLYSLAKSKTSRKRRIEPIDSAEENQGRRDLLVQNVKRTTGTLFASLFYGARMLPHAIMLIISLRVSTPTIDAVCKIILLIKYIFGVIDPIVQCLSIKMIKEGLRAELISLKDTVTNIFSSQIS